MANWLAVVDDTADLAALARGVQRCRACPLWHDNHGGVAGAGPDDAALVLVGEQPGDHEDRQQRPFVGPAGRVLDACLVDAGIDRSAVFLTNAVKHFAHKGQGDDRTRGKRRLHRRPSDAEIAACRPWLRGELRNLRPRVLVLLGAVATAAVLGDAVAVSALRGVVVRTDEATWVLPTWHPSIVLRSRAFDPAAAGARRQELVDDLAAAAVCAAVA